MLDRPHALVSDFDAVGDPQQKLIVQAEVLRAKLDIPRLKRKLRRQVKWQAFRKSLFGLFRRR